MDHTDLARHDRLTRAARIERAAVLYRQLAPAAGARGAYAAAVKLARLTTAGERAALRTALETL